MRPCSNGGPSKRPDMAVSLVSGAKMAKAQQGACRALEQALKLYMALKALNSLEVFISKVFSTVFTLLHHQRQQLQKHIGPQGRAVRTRGSALLSSKAMR